MFDTLIDILKKDARTIVYTEGNDPRILEAAARFKKDGFLTPILVGNVDEVKKVAADNNFDIEGLEIIDPVTYDKMDEMVDTMVELRKGKNTPEECREMLSKGNYFGTMLVKMGVADSLLGGATYSTADTVRPALQIVKTKPGSNIVSSSMIMMKEGERTLAVGDCAINIDPTAEELAEIATETAITAKTFGLDPKVAMLSYSTLGSGSGESVEKVREATKLVKERDPELKVEGEIQFDAAYAPEVAKTKCPDSQVAGEANVFIFPDINSGNIAHKMGQRLGKYDVYGPIMQGLNAPINDLSRGCNADEVYMMSIITAALA